jgi:hypothetical protein
MGEQGGAIYKGGGGFTPTPLTTLLDKPEERPG